MQDQVRVVAAKRADVEQHSAVEPAAVLGLFDDDDDSLDDNNSLNTYGMDIDNNRTKNNEPVPIEQTASLPTLEQANQRRRLVHNKRSFFKSQIMADEATIPKKHIIMEPVNNRIPGR